MRIILLTIFSILSLALPLAHATAETISPSPEKAYFTIEVPAGWTQEHNSFGLSQEEKKVFGVDLTSSEGGAPLPSRISVQFYAPGNLVHKSAQRFIQMHSKPIFDTAEDGETFGPVETRRIGNHTVHIFERTTIRFVPPHAVDPQKIPVYERFAVITTAAGFYVLRLSCSQENAARDLTTYQSVLTSFKPLRDKAEPQ